MKHLVIANPAAGKGKGRVLIPKVEQKLREYGLDFDLILTERPWHAAELARQAVSAGYGVIAAAGGDGTINEVINGLMAARQPGKSLPGLGVICIGRGNDFAYGAGLPTHWEEGCKALAHGSRRAIDVGYVRGDCLNGTDGGQGGRYFGNGIGIGFDALVNMQATRMRLSGFLGYMVAALRTLLLDFKSPLVRIECDQVTITQPSIMISIMNGRRMGGGFLMTPESITSDGLLDLCIAHKVSRATILRMMPRFMRGTQAGHPAVRFERSRRVTVTADQDPLPLQVDGESICTNARRLEVEILPGSLEVIAP